MGPGSNGDDDDYQKISKCGGPEKLVTEERLASC
jgi:hypothetical protein